MTNLYTRIGNGLNYQDANGNWVPSVPIVRAFSGGIVCTGASYQVILATNLNTAGAVDLLTSDRKRMVSHPLALAFLDPVSGKSVVLALIQDCQAQLVSSNRIVYPDAFKGNGIQASVVYHYDVGRFSQDVTFQNMPVTPADFNLGERTRLEVLTEFEDTPVPTMTRHIVERETNATLRAKMTEPDLVDNLLNFGQMWMPVGHALPPTQSKNQQGPPPRGVPVAKHWGSAEGHTVLFEILPWKSVASKLKELPQQASARPVHPASFRLDWSRSRLLQPNPSFNARLAQVVHSSPTLLASTTANSKPRPSEQDGFMMDYSLVQGGGPYTTFQSGHTYLVNSQVTLFGVVYFQAGAVIKYGTFSSIHVEGHIDGLFFGGSPVVFTSMNDDSVGETIDGSSGYPSYSAAYAIDWESYGDQDSYLGPTDMRWCYGAVTVNDTSGHTLYLIHPSFENSSYCVYNNSGADPVHLGPTYVCNVNLIAHGDVTFDNDLTDCSPNQDTDGDSLADVWEVTYFHNLNHSGTEDYDGDGLNNLQEYQLGTDPTVSINGLTTSSALDVFTLLKN